MITLTERAVQAVSRFIDGAETPVAGLRVSVSGARCSGFQYGLRLEKAVSAGDTVVNCGGVHILIDSACMPLLNGVKVDFVDSAEGPGFLFENPNASASCSCGDAYSA